MLPKPTDISEAGLESLIVKSLVDDAGYIQGQSSDFDREHAVDLPILLGFIQATQPETFEHLGIATDGPSRAAFLYRLYSEITKHGIIHVLRKGVRHNADSVTLMYGTPTPGNAKAAELHAQNVFSVTRQLHYSKDETKLALDLAVFINGLPVMTFELKNNLTKQTAADAVQQYKNDRSPSESLFQFGRCMVHFALDEMQAQMCTKLEGDKSWFLPFNKGFNDGAGNPPNPAGLATDYLWKQVLAKDSLINIIENFAQVVVDEKEAHGKIKKERKQVFPRYHQLDVVRKLLADAEGHGPGKRYLIQHSAGSGKSNSITWLAHQLVGLKHGDKPVFDSIIVVTDRRILDRQIRDNIKQFAQVGAVVGAVTQGSGQLKAFLTQEKKIIITTVQKFPFILDEIGDQHRGKKFAIIIDEAHSSQGGRVAAKMNIVLAEHGGQEEDESYEDLINRIMESRKLLPNASYFAFTATPKNKTLELFGVPFVEGQDTKFRAFHSYTMKQAIQEGFILDVLQHYTPINSYYKLMKTVEEDPEFDVKKAQKKLRRFVESNEHAIRQKTEIMVDHFHDQVLAKRKIGGKARAMVCTGSIERAIQYKETFDAYLQERKSQCKAIVAFSGEHKWKGAKVTESSMNGFPSAKIKDKVHTDPYRFLIVADKFQTGYDEPLLHTMYVDKVLSGVKAVQTLSRLNRSHPQKHDTFVLDFANDTDTIQLAFSDYYRTTILSEATDPNMLHDLKADLDHYQVYSWEEVEVVVQLFLTGASREQLEPQLTACVARYITELDEDGQVDFKGKAKAFSRTYNFLAAILSFNMPDWEKLSTFLLFLIPKLPAPKEEDLSKGILEAIDMDSYRVEKLEERNISLADEDAEIGPIPISGGGHMQEPELDKLSVILKTFNEHWGNIDWLDKDKILHLIGEEIPGKVAADKAYINAQTNSDQENARIEHDKALEKVMTGILADHTELYKLYKDDPSFNKWLREHIFLATYKPDSGSAGE